MRSLRVPLLVAMRSRSALYCYVNYAKFGTLFSVPFKNQLSAVSAYNRRILARNGGSRFNPALVPTSLLQYLRPDALQFRSLFPWVSVGAQSTNIGHVVTERVGARAFRRLCRR